MKRIFSLALCLLLFAGPAIASSYNYISAEEMRQRLENKQDTLIVDIQVEKEFRRHHLPGAMPTYAYPVKSEGDRDKIDPAISRYQQSKAPVVIICPRGRGGAKRTYDYMQSRNVPADQLYILESGMTGWPYEDLIVSE